MIIIFLITLISIVVISIGLMIKIHNSIDWTLYNRYLMARSIKSKIRDISRNPLLNKLINREIRKNLDIILVRLGDRRICKIYDYSSPNILIWTDDNKYIHLEVGRDSFTYFSEFDGDVRYYNYLELKDSNIDELIGYIDLIDDK
jgi:hypothetical protein